MAEDDFKFDNEDPEDFLNNPLGDGSDGDPENDVEKEVSVVGVFEHRPVEDEPMQEFVVLVRDNQRRTVVIVIGRFEAVAISLALEGVNPDRPLTHDLLNNVIERLGGKINHILIDDLWNGTYYAKITIETGKNEVIVDSRPSDAIALALRSKAPIYMKEKILFSAGMQEE